MEVWILHLGSEEEKSTMRTMLSSALAKPFSLGCSNAIHARIHPILQAKRDFSRNNQHPIWFSKIAIICLRTPRPSS